MRTCTLAMCVALLSALALVVRAQDTLASKPRLIVPNDIENEPDDSQSMVRLLTYANELRIEGLIATTSTHLRTRVAPDAIRDIIRAYAKVHAEDGKPQFAHGMTQEFTVKQARTGGIRRLVGL